MEKRDFRGGKLVLSISRPLRNLQSRFDASPFANEEILFTGFIRLLQLLLPRLRQRRRVRKKKTRVEDERRELQIIDFVVHQLSAGRRSANHAQIDSKMRDSVDGQQVDGF